MKFLRALYYSTATFVYAVLTFICGAVVLTQVLTYTTGQESLTRYSLIRLGVLSLAGYLLWRLTLKRWNQARPASAPANAEPGSGEFYSRVAGTTFENQDGTNRQQLIRLHCAPGVPLHLTREPDNEFDSAAIAVFCKGVQIGYLPSHLANEYADDVDAKRIEISARVKEITGGGSTNPSLGVNIIVGIRDR